MLIELNNANSFKLKAGDICTLISLEEFNIPLDVAGHIGLRSFYTRRGVIPFSGPQLDPGFNGVLLIGLFNASPKDIMIRYMDPIFTLEFIKLLEPATIGYDGEYQNQSGITLDQIHNVINSEGMSFVKIPEELSSLSKNVNSLTTDVGQLTTRMNTLRESLNTMKWTFGMGMAFLSIIMTLIALLK